MSAPASLPARWMHGLAAPPRRHIRFLAEHGFEAVVAGGDPETVETCAAHGMALYLCSGAFGKGNFPDEFLCVDVHGDRRLWFGSTCPNRPEVRAANLESIAAMAATDGIAGIYIDGCRFASPASGREAFFTCFCPACEDKAGHLGFDFRRMKKDATALYAMITGGASGAPWTYAAHTPAMLLSFLIDHPGLLDWLRFREACTTEHLKDMRAVIKGVNEELVFAIYIFTPSLAPLVGQHYVALNNGVCDLFSPMIYRNFPPPDGPACFNRELYDVAGWFPGDETAVMEALANFFGVPSSSRRRLEEKGLPPQVVGDETRRARSLLGGHTPLVPIIYLDDPEIEASMQAALDGGADGLSFFVYREELHEAVVRAGRCPAHRYPLFTGENQA